MSTFELARANLLSPIMLCFALGVIATLTRSDLKFPEPVFTALTIFLMLSIGIRGGAELAHASFAKVALPALGALALGFAVPIWTYGILRGPGRFGVADAAAVAAHYGSVSAVTFAAALAWMDQTRLAYEGFAPTLLALMEVPGIVVALSIARLAGDRGGRTSEAMREILSGKSILLLVGGLAVGWASGPAGYAKVKPFFGDLFQGVLCLFLLELGMLAAARMRDFRKVGPFLAAFALIMPVVHGALGAIVAQAVGLSEGGAVVLATLTASASYIAAPAAVRLALPEANPSLYLTASLAITFPFNLTIGLPLYGAIAGYLYR